MVRHVFYSFEYAPDNYRVSQVRNIGAISGNKACHQNNWETVTRGGDPAIRRWINHEMQGRSTTIVLIGSTTANRKWINYEIEKSWADGKAVLGIHIHNIRGADRQTTIKGANPFKYVKWGTNETLASVVPVYDPPHTLAASAYNHIAANVSSWIEHAHTVRSARAS